MLNLYLSLYNNVILLINCYCLTTQKQFVKKNKRFGGYLFPRTKQVFQVVKVGERKKLEPKSHKTPFQVRAFLIAFLETTYIL